MIIAAIVIYIIGVWFFWLGSHDRSEFPDIYKRSLPILWPLYLVRFALYTFLFSLIAFLKVILSDARNIFKRSK